MNQIKKKPETSFDFPNAILDLEPSKKQSVFEHAYAHFGGSMKLLILVVLAFSQSTFATWDEDFKELKDRPASYENTGSICEEVGRLQVERELNSPNFEVVTGIEYGDNSRTIGELDIVVFDKKSGDVVHVAEVKCWKDMRGGLKKAREQRSRFLKAIHSGKKLYFRSTLDQHSYSSEVFENVNDFTTMGQKGTKKSGYDAELEYDLSQLHKMRGEMLDCQSRGECATP